MPEKNIYKFLDTFSPKVDEKCVEAGKDWLVKQGRYFSRVANFCGIGPKGGLEPLKGSACHYGIGGLTSRHYVATENGWSRRLKNTQLDEQATDLSIMEPFLRWLLSDDCIYSKFIVNRDDFEFCRDHGFIVTGEAPFKLLQNLMILTRHFYEVNTKSFRKFNELLEKGVTPFLAYMTTFNVYNSCSLGARQTEVNGNLGHRVHCLFGLDAFKAYKKGDVTPEDGFGKPYIEHASIHGGSVLFQDKSDTTYTEKGALLRKYDKEFNNLILESRGEKTKVEGYRPPNPFEAKRTPAYPDVNAKWRMTYEELYNVFVPYIEEKVFKNHE